MTRGPSRGSARPGSRRPGAPRTARPDSESAQTRNRGPSEPRGPARDRERSDARRPGGGRFHVEFIYEDDEIVVIDKPSGLPVIAPDNGRGKSAQDYVTAHIQRTNKRGRAAVLHRIDRDTSGIVVFGKSADAKRRIMGDWSELVEERRYVALVEGRLPAEEDTLESWLVENRAGTVYECRPGTRGALEAITHYRVLAEGRTHSLVELELETGRKHQIRVQLAALGHPVAGDSRYGARTDPAGRLCLHAATIALRKCKGGELLRFESPPPAEFGKMAGAKRPR